LLYISLTKNNTLFQGRERERGGGREKGDKNMEKGKKKNEIKI